MKEQIIICSNSGCTSSGGLEVLIKFLDAIYNNPLLTDRFEVKKGGCHGLCELGPTAIVGSEKSFYIRLDEEKAEEIIKSHLLGGEVVEKYLFYDEKDKRYIYSYDNIPFFAKQVRRILKDSPFIDPENFADYRAGGGFLALEKVLNEYPDPFALCELIKESGLRGRGGGGFLTGEKWELFAKQISQPKYIICNGDEGDPGTYMDRSLLESDPYRILEGIIIAGYATMANSGILYIRKDYDLAIKRIALAIDRLYTNGLLGGSIMEKPFSFDIKIEIGQGAYICGEETALISSIESRRGNPRVKPPYPIEEGLFGSPTMVNNVETFANIRDIINLGSEEYASQGTSGSKGTKIIALSGAARNSGLLEVPFGKSLDYIINEIGGGVAGTAPIKAVQVGGASGTIIPPSLLKEELSFESLEAIESSLGAGGIIVLDENTCMVNITRYYVEFAEKESCGFCVPCREGTQKISNILKRIITGKGVAEDVEKLKDISQLLLETSMCGLGREAVNPVLSLLRYFQHELDEHIFSKRCPAAVCPDLVKYIVIPAKCIGCQACKHVCPVNAITGYKRQYHTIDSDLCIRCGQCYKICPKDAIIRG